MDGTRPQPPLTEAQLDRELEATLRIEPTPEFLARVRTRIANEPETTAWRLADVVSGFSRTFQNRAVEPVAAIAVIAVVVALVVPRMMRDEQPVSATAAVGAVKPTAISQPPAIAKPAAVATSSGRADQAGPSGQVPQLHLSPVMFSEEERKALIALVTAVELSRVPPMPVAETAATASESAAPPRLQVEPLVIEPLVIEPLALLAAAGQPLERTEGERE